MLIQSKRQNAEDSPHVLLIVFETVYFPKFQKKFPFQIGENNHKEITKTIVIIIIIITINVKFSFLS